MNLGSPPALHSHTIFGEGTSNKSSSHKMEAEQETQGAGGNRENQLASN